MTNDQWTMTQALASVRVAGPADAAAISGLLFEFNGEGLAPDELARRMAEVAGLETVFVGELAGSPAGLLVLRTAPAVSNPDPPGEITELYVRPSARQRGVGRALVEAAVAHAQTRSCTEVHLLVSPENEGALSFYEALGFRRDSWEMRRRL